MFQTTDLAKFQNRPNTTIRVLALLEAKKGQGKELMDIFLGLIQPTRREDGNIAYVPHYSTDNPDKILFDELWIDIESYYNHFKQPHMKDLLQRIEHLLAKPLVLETYREVEVRV